MNQSKEKNDETEMDMNQMSALTAAFAEDVVVCPECRRSVGALCGIPASCPHCGAKLRSLLKKAEKK